jgi:hypothetical protein
MAGCDGSGSTFYYNKTINQWAPSYKQIFKTGPVEEEVEIPTQRSSSSSRESQAGCVNMKATNTEKTFKKPGFNFMIPRREEVDDDNKNK